MHELYDLRVDNVVEPIGVDNPHPRFAWKIRSEERGWKQRAYRIVAENNGKTVWDSGKVMSDRSVFIEYRGVPLASFGKYLWTVTVWDKSGNAAVASSFFETGLSQKEFIGSDRSITACRCFARQRL